MIAAANNDKPPETELFSIIYNIHSLKKLFPSWKISFTYGEVNWIAHLLAKSTCLSDEDIVWIEDVPSFNL